MVMMMRLDDDGDDDDDEEAATQKLGPHFVRTCAVEMHFNMSQGPLFTEIYRMSPKCRQPKTHGAHISYEPAQSKRMSRFHKSHLIRKFTGKMPQTQNCGADFVRACAVETHVKISQQATLYGNLQEKCRGP